MKKIFQYNYLIIGLMATMGAGAFVACQKDIIAADPVGAACAGSPSMSAVALPSNRDTSLKEAKMTDWIIVKGANLCTPTKVLVNDIDVNVAEISASGNEFTFKIPKALPKTINNKITFTNAVGTSTFDFKIIVPDLAFTGYGGDIEEYTPVGQNLIIKGQNLDLYGYTLETTTVLFGTTSVKPTKVTDSEVHVTVPTSAVANTVVKVKNATLEKEVPIYYKDKRGVIYDLDPLTGWTPTVVSNGPTPPPVLNNYCAFATNYASGWGWQEDMHIANMVKLADYGITAGAASRFVVKFEVNVTADWTSDPMRIWWKSKTGTFNYNFPWGGGSFNGTAYKTSGWKTVTIPLADFIYSEDDAGAKKGQKVTALDAESVGQPIEIRLFIQGPDAKKLNTYWDNFRIVPKY